MVLLHLHFKIIQCFPALHYLEATGTKSVGVFNEFEFQVSDGNKGMEMKKQQGSSQFTFYLPST